MDNSENQKEELFSVESIFNLYEKNLTIEDKNPPCGHFKANTWLPENFYIIYSNIPNHSCETDIPEAAEVQSVEKFEVKHLPPINLFFELPSTYPSDTGPAFFLSCNWLTLEQISKICRHLESIWEEDMPILYTWFQFLESEVMEFLCLQSLDITELLTYKVSNNFRLQTMEDKITNSSENSNITTQSIKLKEYFPIIKPSVEGGSKSIDQRAFNDLNDGRSLIQILKSFNEFKAMDVFNQKYHECSVCLTSKIGTDFATFKVCSHSFCKECLKGFFEVHIREGNVTGLCCPSPKCDSQADGSMVRQIVDKELFERYDTILLSRTLETMADIAYCPRKWCQCPVLIEPAERIGSCPSCLYSFCPFCKMAYHGVAPCVFKSEEKQAIFDKYMNGDASVKELLEKRHGKRAIKALVEDFLSEDWKNSNSKSCPHCKANIEKNDGCNKMTCFKCGEFFCWLCMQALNSANPYNHYSNSGCILFPQDQINDFYEFGPGDFLHFF